MSKSAIYTVNSTDQILAAGSTIDLGSIIRRFGQNINLNGNNIVVSGAGYYNIDVQVTITGTTAGTATITLMKDNVAVQGANASYSLAVGDVTTIGINALIREYGCCCNNTSNLSLMISGIGATINNVAVVIEKE